MTSERHPIKRDSMGLVPIGRAMGRAGSAPASPPASPSGTNTPEWARKLATIGPMLTEEAIRVRVNLDDPQEQFRLETLVQDAARELSVEAVQVAILEHRKHSPFMPALCDLMQHSAQHRRERADDARRAADEQAARASRLMLPAPSKLTDADVKRMLDAIAAAPGPDGKPLAGRSASQAYPPPVPPAQSDLSPELRALAIERGWVKVVEAA
jgi:hypothetical protein